MEEPEDNGKNHRRRSSRSKRPSNATAQSLPPGRAPIGFVPANIIRSSASSIPTSKADIDNQSAAISHPLSLPEQPSSSHQLSLPLFRFEAVISTSASEISPKLQNMSTLGSMARAAEYQAAKAAKARQVSREAEAQKLPPKSTPVSLCAFTKAQPCTRNKGNKAWKPLTSDDLGGEGIDSRGESLASHESAPSLNPQIGNAERPNTGVIPAGLASGGIEDLKIPTAPKAMLIQRDRSTNVSNAAALQHLNHAPVNPSPQAYTGSEEATGHEVQGRSLSTVPPSSYSYLHSRRSAYLPEMQSLGSHLDQSDPITNSSPYAHSSHYPVYETPTRGGPQVPHVSHHMFNVAQLPLGVALHSRPPFGTLDESQNQFHHPHEYDSSSYAQMHPPGHAATPPAYFPQQQANNFQSTPPMYAPIGTNVSQRAILYNPDQGRPEMPYDRARTMQQAKATLEKASLERKGKTVLHNPDLYRSEEDQKGQGIASETDGTKHGKHSIPFHVEQWQELETNMLDLEKKRREEHCAFSSTNEIAIQPQSSDLKEFHTVLRPDIFGRGMILMRRPPPGLELPIECKEDKQNGGLKTFSNDFWELKPMGLTELKRTRRLAQEARDYLAGTTKTPLYAKVDGQSINAVRIKLSEELFNRRGRIAAKMHEQAIQDHALEPKSEEEQSAETMVIENVISNFRYYVDQCKLPEEERSLPFKVKPVPDYAIERPSVLTGGTSIFSSFFEETSTKGESEKNILPTPKRIARDPRFRPAVPSDGGKLSMEEERMARRDLYGRRVW